MEKRFSATLSRSQGRSAWAVIFRHPVRVDPNTGKPGLRVRQGLGTPDETEANDLKDQIRKTYPQGMLVQQDRQAAIQMQVDLPARQKMIEDYLQAFPPQTDADRDVQDQLWSRLAAKLADQKQWDQFKTVSQKMRPAARASLYNNISWNLAENGEDLAQAKMLAAEAANVEYQGQQMGQPGTRQGQRGHAVDTVAAQRGHGIQQRGQDTRPSAGQGACRSRR